MTIIYETCMGTGNLRWFSVGDVLFGELSEWLVAKPVAIASNIEHECGLSLGADVGAGKADKRAGTRNWAAFDWQYRYIQTINQLLPPPRHHHRHLCCQCNHLFSSLPLHTHTHPNWLLVPTLSSSASLSQGSKFSKGSRTPEVITGKLMSLGARAWYAEFSQKLSFSGNIHGKLMSLAAGRRWVEFPWKFLKLCLLPNLTLTFAPLW